MSAAVLPDADDFDLNPEAEMLLEEERRALGGRLPDFNESTVARIETPTELDVLNEREARRQARQAEAIREPEAPNAVQQPTSVPSDFGASLSTARDQLALLEALTPQQPEVQQPASNAADATDDEVEFFRSPKTAVEKAISNHPAMAALKGAITQTYQRKTSEQFAKEFPEAEQTMADPKFRQWAAASKVRMALLQQAHERYDLEAAREVFGNWKALRGSSASSTGAKSGGKVYSRAQIRRLMIEDPRKYEAMADDIAAAYASGRVR